MIPTSPANARQPCSSVVVCDDGETGATEVATPWATDTIESFDVAEIERRVGGFSADDFVLIVTRDHAIDLRLLEQLIAHDELGYLGMIGSRGKVGRFRKRLEVRGLVDGELGAARWARLRAPVGLNVGAETPEEIAISVVGEMIAMRRSPNIDWRSLSKSVFAHDNLRALLK